MDKICFLNKLNTRDLTNKSGRREYKISEIHELEAPLIAPSSSTSPPPLLLVHTAGDLDARRERCGRCRPHRFVAAVSEEEAQ
ncbi:hypothetical protein RHMOL_Rhmol12G0138300 [Rhododendron molle]|uniref:Uncharacterized protein n=1 Tax=Rhododendron molle TaxID=49168 RepID=A0ACC0LHP3_RHOML|nr:hypothetical protein RHMOL_Rhmol12G0138300 [Rhododendron molle]